MSEIKRYIVAEMHKDSTFIIRGRYDDFQDAESDMKNFIKENSHYVWSILQQAHLAKLSIDKLEDELNLARKNKIKIGDDIITKFILLEI